MPLQTESKMLWYNESDLDSEENEGVRKGTQKERRLEWAQKDMKGAMKKTRRSPRKKPKTDDVGRGTTSRTLNLDVLLTQDDSGRT